MEKAYREDHPEVTDEQWSDLEPASTRQCWYLAKLMLEAGDDGSEILLNTSFLLTKREGSKLIKFHLND